MGRDKALIEIDGIPLWQRQIRVLAELEPAEIFIAGPPRDTDATAAYTFLEDATPAAGPLSGLAAALCRCVTTRLLALAVDLPNMTVGYLRQLLAQSRDHAGVVPIRGIRYEPLAAVYPKSCLAWVQAMLRQPRCSLQNLCAVGKAEGWLLEKTVAPEDDYLFTNMNTPEDLAALSRHHA